MEAPKTSEEVAALEGCTPRAVQKWAARNGVYKIGKGNRAQYLFYEEDIERFRKRQGPGRPWPGKEGGNGVIG
jgi:hypothetical protein